MGTSSPTPPGPAPTDAEPPIEGTEQFDEVVTIGASGFGQMILQLLATQGRGPSRVVAAVDDLDNGFAHPHLGCPVISSDQRLELFPTVPVLLTVGSPALRARMVARLRQERACFATVTPRGLPTAHPSATYGPGSVVTPHTLIGPEVTIGACTLIAAENIAHHVTVGDYSTVNLRSTVFGHVVIGSRVNIAPAAAISNGTSERPLYIGDDAVIGAAAVVARDVEPGAHMVGNPATTVEVWRRIKRLAEESLRDD